MSLLAARGRGQRAAEAMMGLMQKPLRCDGDGEDSELGLVAHEVMAHEQGHDAGDVANYKRQDNLMSRRETKVHTVNFDAGGEPIGFEWRQSNVDLCVVTAVSSKGQADRHGVRPGWKILDSDLLQGKVNSNAPFTVDFSETIDVRVIRFWPGGPRFEDLTFGSGRVLAFNPDVYAIGNVPVGWYIDAVDGHPFEPVLLQPADRWQSREVRLVHRQAAVQSIAIAGSAQHVVTFVGDGGVHSWARDSAGMAVYAHDERQAQRLGVQKGWQPILIDGQSFTEEVLAEKEKGSMPYTVVFCDEVRSSVLMHEKSFKADEAVFEVPSEGISDHLETRVERLQDGSVFEGQFRGSDKHGYGRLTWIGRGSYEGQFDANDMHGEGSFIWSDGSVYQGQWQHGKKDGEGKLTLPDGRSYAGQWDHGEFVKWTDEEHLSINCRVRVLVDFKSKNTDDPLMLQRGLQGHIKKFSPTTGSAYIDFNGLDTYQWVHKSDFDKLRVIQQDQPGDYTITHRVIVSETVAMDSRDMGALEVGTRVCVLEVVKLPEKQIVRGRLEDPAGWISLLNTEDGFRWAEQAEQDVGECNRRCWLSCCFTSCRILAIVLLLLAAFPAWRLLTRDGLSAPECFSLDALSRFEGQDLNEIQDVLNPCATVVNVTSARTTPLHDIDGRFRQVGFYGNTSEWPMRWPRPQYVKEGNDNISLYYDLWLAAWCIRASDSSGASVFLTSSFAACPPEAQAVWYYFDSSQEDTRRAPSLADAIATQKTIANRNSTQVACPAGYLQLGAIGDDIPWTGLSLLSQNASSIGDCASQCDREQDCGAFKFGLKYGSACHLVHWSQASRKCQTQTWDGVLTCRRTPSSSSVRLVGGNTTSGILEVRRDGEWFAVSDWGFNPVGAKVVCRELGLSGGTPVTTTPEDLRRSSRSRFWNGGHGNVSCAGNESTLTACDFRADARWLLGPLSNIQCQGAYIDMLRGDATNVTLSIVYDVAQWTPISDAVACVILAICLGSLAFLFLTMLTKVWRSKVKYSWRGSYYEALGPADTRRPTHATSPPPVDSCSTNKDPAIQLKWRAILGELMHAMLLPFASCSAWLACSCLCSAAFQLDDPPSGVQLVMTILAVLRVCRAEKGLMELFKNGRIDWYDMLFRRSVNAGYWNLAFQNLVVLKDFVFSKFETVDSLSDGIAVAVVFLLESFSDVFRTRLLAIWGAGPVGRLLAPAVLHLGLSGIMVSHLAFAHAVQFSSGLRALDEREVQLPADLAGFGLLAKIDKKKVDNIRPVTTGVRFRLDSLPILPFFWMRLTSEAARDPAVRKDILRIKLEGVPQILFQSAAVIAAGGGLLANPELLLSLSVTLLMAVMKYVIAVQSLVKKIHGWGSSRSLACAILVTVLAPPLLLAGIYYCWASLKSLYRGVEEWFLSSDPNIQGLIRVAIMSGAPILPLLAPLTGSAFLPLLAPLMLYMVLVRLALSEGCASYAFDLASWTCVDIPVA